MGREEVGRCVFFNSAKLANFSVLHSTLYSALSDFAFIKNKCLPVWATLFFSSTSIHVLSKPVVSKTSKDMASGVWWGRNEGGGCII